MPQARITNLEAFELLRARLILFRGKAARALDDAGDAVRQTRQWLAHDQRAHWEMELRQRHKKLEAAEGELLSAKLSGHREAIITRQAAVRRWQESLAEAEAKRRALKQWSVQFDGVADPMLKRLEDLRQYLDLDAPQAIAYLANIQKTLEGYTEAPAPSASSAPAASTSATSTPPTP